MRCIQRSIIVDRGEKPLALFFKICHAIRQFFFSKEPGIAGTQFEIKIKPPPPGTGMVLLFHRESIGKSLSLFSWYQIQQEDAYQLSSSARMAGVVCANEDQIRRQGRCNNSKMNGAYLTSLPKEMMRSMAGFPTNVDPLSRTCRP
jgi:hypothetical protein